MVFLLFIYEVSSALTTAIITSAISVYSLTYTATAQSANYYAGLAIGGQSVNVDLDSINPASSRSVDFVYYLDNDRRYSQADCKDGTWTPFADGVVHRPQSQATQNMLDVVCGYQSTSSQPELAVVFAPPSNIRANPNGAILCSVRTRANINIYGSTGEWYYTDTCGQMGVIHSSQLQF